jgi:PemK-like, MazF-like toxin of type II toxin-antitoxin system
MEVQTPRRPGLVRADYSAPVRRLRLSVVRAFGRLAGRTLPKVPPQASGTPIVADLEPSGSEVADSDAVSSDGQPGMAGNYEPGTATLEWAVSARAAVLPGRHLVYEPDLDGRADPGEIVWTWVEYEDEPGHGKDRPVLVVGRAGPVLLGLMLSSRSTRDDEPNWLALGQGEWDGEARPSWVRLDRVLELAEDGIRREGAALDRVRFERIAHELRERYGWT